MVIAYLRKSQEDDGRQVLSLPAQRDAVLELAKRDGLVIDKIYEESFSAKSPGREIFSQMMAEIEKSGNVVILCWKINRLARNGFDGGKITWFMDEGIINEIKTPESIYRNTPSDKYFLLTEFGIAKKNVDDLSVDVKRGNLKKLRNGGWTGPAPFGYLNDIANKTIIVDHERAHFITDIFNLFAGGLYSLKQINDIMYQRGLRSRGGLKLPKSKIHKIITDPFYTGMMVRNGETYKGNHQPLISLETFETCGNRLNPNRSRKQKHLFPLRGYMTCAKCGCLLTATTKKGRYQYYYCTNGRGGCEQHEKYIRAEDLYEQVAARLSALQFDPELIEIACQAYKEKQRSQHDLRQKALEQITKKLSEIKFMHERLITLHLKGKISEEDFDSQAKQLKHHEVSLQTEYNALSSKQINNETALELTKKAFLTANYARKDFLSADDDRKRSLSEKLLWNFTVEDQKIKDFRLKMPYQLMADFPKNASLVKWLGC